MISFADIKEKVNIHTMICNITMAACVMVVLFCFFSLKSPLNYDRGTEVKASVLFAENGAKLYIMDVSKYSNEPMDLSFNSNHHKVYVYMDQKCVYRYDETGGWITDTTGSQYHFVSIPKNTKVVKVLEIPCFDIVKDNMSTFYIGQADIMLKNILTASLPNFLSSLAIIIVGIILISYFIFMNTQGQVSTDIVYLGLFTFFVGVWSLNETDIVNFYTSSRPFCSLLAYFSLMMVPIPLVMFIKGYLEVTDRWKYKLHTGIAIINFWVLTILHFSGIREYKENLIVIQAVLVLSMTYLLHALSSKFIRHQFTRRVKISLFGSLTVIITFLIDILLYSDERPDADLFGRYFFLVFMMLLGFDMLSSTSDMIKKGRHAKVLERFAITDSMTGLYNRNAFESFQATLEDLNGIGVVAFDLNNLKYTNDNYGHDAGDEYIKTMADIIRGCFAPLGDVYRTGGDEFFCVSRGTTAVRLEKAMKEARARVTSKNGKGDWEFSMEIAMGMAVYDKAKDTSFTEICNRADEAMYADKKRLKSVNVS